MPKKIDPELTARAVRLVNEHRGEYTVLLSGMSGIRKPVTTVTTVRKASVRFCDGRNQPGVE
jgi:hypothetical protein